MDELRECRMKVIERAGRCEQHGAFASHAVLLGERVMHGAICPTCAAAIRVEREAGEQARVAQARQLRMEARLNKAGIPPRYRDKDFSSYVVENEGQARVLAAAREFVDNFAQHAAVGHTAVFAGLPGTGKSHLALAIGREIMSRGTVLYISAIDAIRMLRDSWRRDAVRSESQVLQELAAVNLLILDEVGAQYGTDAEQISMFDIIDKRYRDLMPTILLTNLKQGDLKTFLGARSFDRLRENGSWAVFDWASRRGVAGK